MVKICPFAVVIAFRTKELDAIVLTVGHQYPLLHVDPDAMRGCELSLPGTRCTPGAKVLPFRREAMNGRIAVAISHINLAVCCHCNVGRMIEGRPQCWPATVSKHQNDLALGRELEDLVLIAVTHIH